MILTDASAFIAICDKGQGKDHLRCINALGEIKESLITTYPCLTEAMYFLGKLLGWHGQKIFWQLIESDVVEIYHIRANDSARMFDLMAK